MLDQLFSLVSNSFPVSDLTGPLLLIVGAIFLVVNLVIFALAYFFGGLWLQAYMSNADVSMLSLVGMSFRQVDPRVIVRAKITLAQAGLDIGAEHGITTAGLEAHVLAGGNVVDVVQAIIIANRAGINCDFDSASAIDLAGRDVLDAIRTSVLPKVIDCPPQNTSDSATISAIAKDGVELCVHARVTVRANLKQLLGGATDDTIIARVGQGIISTVGSADTHMQVLVSPDEISKGLLSRGLDVNTIYHIVSIDIASINVGKNIGARLQIEQAEADVRAAQALAERRLANAMADQQQMKARVAEMRGNLVLAEADVQSALAASFTTGSFARPKKAVTEATIATENAKRFAIPFNR